MLQRNVAVAKIRIKEPQSRLQSIH